MRGAGLDVDLGRPAPDHHEPVDEVLAPEALDVGSDGLEHRPLVHRALDVGTVQALHVRGVERGGHRAHRAQLGADRLEVTAGVEHAGSGGGHIGVVGEHVPRAEHEIVELRQRHEVADGRHAVLGTRPEPDRTQLRERADRLAHPPARELDAGDERARHRAEPDAQDAQLALGRGDGGGSGGSHGDGVSRPAARAPVLPLPRSTAPVIVGQTRSRVAGPCGPRTRPCPFEIHDRERRGTYGREGSARSGPRALAGRTTSQRICAEAWRQS